MVGTNMMVSLKHDKAWLIISHNSSYILVTSPYRSVTLAKNDLPFCDRYTTFEFEAAFTQDRIRLEPVQDWYE